MKQIKLLFVGITFLLLSATQAGFLVEPYLGYSINKAEVNGSKVYDGRGVRFGGRLGYSMLGFMGGLDYSMGSWEPENTQSVKFDMDSSRIAIFAGYQLPIMLRAWAALILKAKDERNSGDESEGNGFKLGVGFTGLPFLSLNLEYQTLTFDKFNGNATADTDQKEIIFSVSAPFNL